MGKITFRTVSQAILFESELKGQISDGHWENSGHDFRPWCDAEICVGEQVGRDFDVKYDRYNFLNRSLLEVVAVRMIAYVRLGLAYGRENVHILEHLLDPDGNFQGLPMGEDDYTKQVFRDIVTLLVKQNASLGDVKRAVECGETYRLPQLLADLREMKNTIKVRK